MGSLEPAEHLLLPPFLQVQPEEQANPPGCWDPLPGREGFLREGSTGALAAGWKTRRWRGVVLRSFCFSESQGEREQLPLHL